MEKKRIIEVLDTGVLAGKIMLESGAEMYRVEDTIDRIVRKGGLNRPELFTTQTGIFVSADETYYTKMAEIKSDSINLEKVSQVNDLSRKYVAGDITLDQLHSGLRKINWRVKDFPFRIKLIGAFLTSCTLMILFTGKYDWFDFIQAGIVGTIGYIVDYYIQNVIRVKFISEFIASAVIALLAVFLKHIGLLYSVNYLIIGAVMPLVPGVALTNALRDLLSGHLISGLSRMTDGTLTAIAIGAGIASVLKFII